MFSPAFIAALKNGKDPRFNCLDPAGSEDQDWEKAVHMVLSAPVERANQYALIPGISVRGRSDTPSSPTITISDSPTRTPPRTPPRSRDAVEISSPAVGRVTPSPRRPPAVTRVTVTESGATVTDSSPKTTEPRVKPITEVTPLCGKESSEGGGGEGGSSAEGPSRLGL